LCDDVTAKVLAPLKLTGKIDGLFPSADGGGGVFTYTTNGHELRLAGTENRRGVAPEMIQQLPQADWTDVLDHVQGDESFLGVHVGEINYGGTKCNAFVPAWSAIGSH
jgi:hypothetical protein